MRDGAELFTVIYSPKDVSKNILSSCNARPIRSSLWCNHLREALVLVKL
jgi:hypothetical protein